MFPVVSRLTAAARPDGSCLCIGRWRIFEDEEVALIKPRTSHQAAPDAVDLSPLLKSESTAPVSSRCFKSVERSH